MTAANRLTGSNLLVNWTKTGGTLAAITGDQTKFSFSRKMDTVDVTAGSETERYFLATVESLDFTLNIFDAGQTFKANCLPGDTGLLEIQPTGTGTGKPVVSFNALITGYDEDFPFDGALEITITGVRNGAMIQEVGTVQT